MHIYIKNLKKYTTHFQRGKQDLHDRKRQDMQDNNRPLYFELTQVILVGLLVNFGKRRIEYKRLHNPDYPAACDHAYPEF